MPARDQRMDLVIVSAPHPSTLPINILGQEIQKRFQRRSGPGGQHRNKTSSGVFLLHQPTDVVAEATERRSQADNRAVATARLRFKLAVQVRSPGVHDQVSGEPIEHESIIRDRYAGTRMKLNDANVDKPAVLALILNDLHASGGQPSLVSGDWAVSTSSLIHLLKSQPEAFALVNSIRTHHGHRALK